MAENVLTQASLGYCALMGALATAERVARDGIDRQTFDQEVDWVRETIPVTDDEVESAWAHISHDGIRARHAKTWDERNRAVAAGEVADIVLASPWE